MTLAYAIPPGHSEADNLRWRIFNVIPASEYCMNTLLGLLEIVVTETVPTAAVRCGTVPVMLINPEFVREWCVTDEDLFVLVMHELHHLLLGHTRLFPCVTEAHNIAFDAVINAYLCRLFPPEYSRFFTRFYSPTEPPYFLLRPPCGWPKHPEWMLPAKAGAAEHLCHLHKRLYSLSGVTYDEIFQALALSLAQCELTLPDGSTPLLGDHDSGSAIDPYDTDAKGDQELLRSIIRRVVENWKPSTLNPRGRSLAGAIQEEFVPRVTPPDNGSIIRAAFRHAASGSAGNAMKEIGFEPRLLTGPLPAVTDRRANVARFLGHRPLLFTREVEDRSVVESGRVHLYVDVSGSLNAFLPCIYASLRPFASSLHPRVCLFSTELTEISINDLMRGKRVTTLGTDIYPVIEHILKNRVRKALILTDGWTGGVGAQDRALLKALGTKITVLLTPLGTRSDLEPVVDRFYALNDLLEN